MSEVSAMLNDVKTGLTIWKNITNVKYTAVQFFLFAAAGFGANVFAAPRLYERAKIISAALHMGVPKVITALAVLHIIVFGGMMRQIVYESCGRNKDFFYQLAVSKRAGCVCTMFQQRNWYGYGLVILLAICDYTVIPGWFLIPIYTMVFIVGFCIYYDMADAGSRKRKLVFNCQMGREKRVGEGFLRSHPVLELFKITVYGFCQCKGIVAGQMILIMFILYCGNAGMLCGEIFLLADGFLILLGDGYWRKESSNFRYFSEIGIPFSRYLGVHFLTGIGLYILIPLLFFCRAAGRGASAVSFVLLSYLLIFWYLVQIYLYQALGREREGAVILYDIGFLVIAVLPPAGLLAMAWLYKRIVCKWRGTDACGKRDYKIL